MRKVEGCCVRFLGFVGKEGVLRWVGVGPKKLGLASGETGSGSTKEWLQTDCQSRQGVGDRTIVGFAGGWETARRRKEGEIRKRGARRRNGSS